MTTAGNYFFFAEKIRDIRKNEIENSFKYHVKSIDAITDRMKLNVLSLARAGELIKSAAAYSPRDYIKNNIEQYLVGQTQNLPIALGGGIWYEPGSIYADVAYYGPYAFWDSGKVSITWEYSNKTYDYHNRMWYKIAARAIPSDNNRIYITEPYLDTLGASDVIFISMTAPMFNSAGNLTGTATTDWSIDVINKNLDKYSITENSALFLIDRPSMKILFYKNPGDIMKTIDRTEWGKTIDFDAISAGKINTSETTIKGIRHIVVSTETSAGFLFGSLIPYSEAYSAIDFMIGTNIFMVCGFITVLTLIIFILLWKLVFDPLESLSDFGKEISGGNLDKKISPRRMDEIGRIARNLNRMTERLKEGIESIRRIIEYMPSMILHLSSDGKLIQWNRSAESLIAISDIPVERPVSEAVPPLEEWWVKIKNSVHAMKKVSLMKIRLAGFDNRIFNIDAFSLGEDTNADIVIKLDDITEIEKSESLRIQGQKLETIGLLAGGIAHDFNNILTGIIGTVSLLRLMIKTNQIMRPDILDADLDLIESGAQSGAEIVSQLLNIAKRKTISNHAPVNLNEILEQIVKLSANVIGKSVEVRFTIHSGQAYVIGDRSQILQSLLNLIVNGAHAMTIMRGGLEHQGGLITAGIFPFTPDQDFLTKHDGALQKDYWLLKIKDTGVGMDQQTMSRIFDPFFTTKEKGDIKGTGLGLSVVYSIVKSHGGFIEVDSEIGLGTEFRLYLPAATNVQISGASETGKKNLFRGEGLILVIDDDEIVKRTAASLLSACGFSVITAGSGDEGVRLFNSRKDEINAVLLDLVMPGKPGKATLAELISARPGIRVIITSGFYEEDTISEMLKIGAAGFIKKPYDITQLIEIIQPQ